MTVLTRDDTGWVKGFWFEKKKILAVLLAKIRAIYNAYLIAKDKSYLKVLVESDCTLLVDAILGYATCPWTVNATIEDIKLFLEDYPHVSLCWVNRLGKYMKVPNGPLMFYGVGQVIYLKSLPLLKLFVTMNKFLFNAFLSLKKKKSNCYFFKKMF